MIFYVGFFYPFRDSLLDNEDEIPNSYRHNGRLSRTEWHPWCTIHHRPPALINLHAICQTKTLTSKAPRIDAPSGRRHQPTGSSFISRWTATQNHSTLLWNRRNRNDCHATSLSAQTQFAVTKLCNWLQHLQIVAEESMWSQWGRLWEKHQSDVSSGGHPVSVGRGGHPVLLQKSEQ